MPVEVERAIVMDEVEENMAGWQGHLGNLIHRPGGNDHPPVIGVAAERLAEIGELIVWITDRCLLGARRINLPKGPPLKAVNRAEVIFQKHRLFEGFASQRRGDAVWVAPFIPKAAAHLPEDLLRGDAVNEAPEFSGRGNDGNPSRGEDGKLSSGKIERELLVKQARGLVASGDFLFTIGLDVADDVEIALHGLVVKLVVVVESVKLLELTAVESRGAALR